MTTNLLSVSRNDLTNVVKPGYLLCASCNTGMRWLYAAEEPVERNLDEHFGYRDADHVGLADMVRDVFVPGTFRKALVGRDLEIAETVVVM